MAGSCIFGAMAFQSFVENFPDPFFRRCINITWLISYLVVVNYILFEYTIPFIKFTWKRLLITPVLLILHSLLIQLDFIYGDKSELSCTFIMK